MMMVTFFLLLVPLVFAADSPNIVIVLTDDQVRQVVDTENGDHGHEAENDNHIHENEDS